MNADHDGLPSQEVLASLFGDRTESIYTYIDLLTVDGIHRGLVGPREADRLWDRHILNCAVISPVFPVGTVVCDLGSGAGLPGIVLAIARPDLRLVLLEPLLRRTVFLGEVVEKLELCNVEVVRGRAEDVRSRPRVDAVTARAVAPLERLAGWALPLVKPGGELVAIKGAGAADEIAMSRDAVRRLGGGPARLESYGAGVVEPVTYVVRIGSRR